MLTGEKELSWTELRRFVQKKDFISLVVNFDPRSVTPALRDKVRGRWQPTLLCGWTEHSDAFGIVSQVSLFRCYSGLIPLQIQKNYLSSEEFTVDRVNNASKACGPLCAWVISQVNYSTILDRVQPLRDEVARLEEALESLEAQQKTSSDAIDALEASIEQYKRVRFGAGGCVRLPPGSGS